MDMQTFFYGNCFDAYEYFGAHKSKGRGKRGYDFRVYAPRAVKVELCGDFSDWKPLPMERDSQGVHMAHVPSAKPGMTYKYLIHRDDGRQVYKCDPYGLQMELPPRTASVIPEDLKSYKYHDQKWMDERDTNFGKPLNIYELHFGSWRTKEDGSWYQYDELPELLIPYLKENGYTHIEILPLSEHPLYASWGYLTSCYFSVTARYGTPKQFMKFVDECHQNGIGVIMDFVPVHFITDDFSLQTFDGYPLYEYESRDIAYSEWGSCNFNMFKDEVRSFLKSAANIWFDYYHVDGLRMDAISNLIYWQGNEGRGTNGGALYTIRGINYGLKNMYKGIMLIAEDSSSFPKVTAPVEYEGLGFDYKWDMGWMNDTMKFFKLAPWERKNNYNIITFSMWYFYNEKYILSLSHDEVVHGKATILQKMWGNYEEKFKQARTLYTYMMTHPGKKLNFMGNEIGQFREWDEKREQDWFMRDYPKHDMFYHFIQDLNQMYLTNPALYETDYDDRCFKWLEIETVEECVYVYERDTVDKRNRIITAMNMQNVHHKEIKVGVDEPLILKELMNTDDVKYDGPGNVNGTIETKKEEYKGHPYSFTIQLGHYASCVFEAIPKEESEEEKTETEKSGETTKESAVSCSQKTL